MISFAVQNGDIALEEVRVFQNVVRGVANIPDSPPMGWSCHEIAVAVAAVFPQLVAVHGSFASPGYRHAWCEFKGRPPFDRLIIDVYPWGGVQPSMVYAGGPGMRLPWYTLFEPGLPMPHPLGRSRVTALATAIAAGIYG